MTKAEKEWLPWYRKPNYKGNLTEDEKRILDSFRAQPKHPAATYADLPDEVQSHISGLSVALMDSKQFAAFMTALFWTAVLGGIFATKYYGCKPIETWDYVLLGLAIALVWANNWRENMKIDEEFRPRGKNAPRATDEAFRFEWELEYLSRRHESLRRKGDV